MTALLEAKALALPGRLFGVSLTLAEGELVALIGPNGSGKTSLLHAIAGIGAGAGEVMIDGASLRSAGSARRPRLLSFLPASRDVRWPLAGRDLIHLGGATHAQVEQVIAQLELGAVADRRVDRLSTGERSRILLARALAPQPRLLLLDEPTANLDPLWQIRLMERLKEQVARTKQAALIAIHDLDAAARYGDRILVMNGGRIAADGRPDEIVGGRVLAEVFGVERIGGEWRPALRPPADRQSSP
jgi:iron complex transport system ATP-binding protein